jgi:hypothetical protein
VSKRVVQEEIMRFNDSNSVSGLILQLQEALEEYGDTLEYSVEEINSWGDTYPVFVIYHNREETDEEYQGRLGRESYYAKMLVEKEKAEYERLTIKFKKPSF